MKEKSNKRRIRSFMAGLLAFVLTVTSVLPGLPAMQVKAATPKTWYKISGSAGNGHAYETPGNASVLLHRTATTWGSAFKTTFELADKKETGGIGFFYSYKDVDNWVYLGLNSGGWYYEWKIAGASDYANIGGFPNPEDGQRTTVSMLIDRETMVVEVDGIRKEVLNKDRHEALKTALGDEGRPGFRNGMTGTSLSFIDTTCGTAKLDTGVSDWEFLAQNPNQAFEAVQVPLYTVTGKVKDSSGKGLGGAKVRVGAESATTGSDGSFSIDVEAGEYVISASLKGYVAYSGSYTVTDQANQAIPDITMKSKGEVTYDHYIENGTVKAAVSDKFPQVYRYEVKDGSGWKYMDGQAADLDTVKINGVNITPTVGTVTFSTDKLSATYPMNFNYHADASAEGTTPATPEVNIKLDMTVKISVPGSGAESKNDLTWEVTEIRKNDGCDKINSIEVPNLNLATISDGQEDAQFMGAVISNNTTAIGDQEITFGEGGGFAPNNSSGYAYAFVSGDGVSAGVWSNSERAKDQRLTRNNGADSISLTSSFWYYEYGDVEDPEKELESSSHYDGTPYSELPAAKVCLALDENGDDVVDWQDGAIEYRDIMNNPYGWEAMKDLVNYRISMNFSSQATNPYLKVADNIKKVYLATDGLPQAVMMKGYGSEGHDSANSEYGNIAERLGGLEDLQKLNTIAHKYNTQTGIHINAQEMYPEAQSFTDDIIVSPDSRGWGWLDQSYAINRARDLGTGIRFKRLLQLYDQLNGTNLYANEWPGVAGQGANETVANDATIASTVAKNKTNKENLDFIYLDVWYGDSWETRRIAEQFNKLGWRFSTEFGYEGEYDATWHHWPTEGHYGGAGAKGFNSDVIRFIRNHQKDAFVLNWPMYGGTADRPLLGGYDTDGFEGWGSNNNFDHYMTTTFAINLPTRWLQHYEVSKWENYSGVGDDVSPVGNHEKQITLKNDKNDTVVVTRKPAITRTPVANEQDTTRYNFVERTITLNGKKVLDDVEYLLPWTDNQTKEEKLYYYNYDGIAATEWELQDGWKNLKNVKIYKLTDTGRTEEKTVAVRNGKVFFADIEAKTPYVVVKGAAGDKNAVKKTIDSWSEAAHVTDTGFNGYADGDSLSSAVWSGDIADEGVKVERVESGNKYLRMGSSAKDLSITTQISGLKSGTNYVAQVYVDNKSDAKARIKVTGAGKQGNEPMEQYTLRSLEGNYPRCDAHNVNAVKGSKMQNMLVSFRATGTTATLALEREKGAGVTYFDDIRIVEKTLANYGADGSFTQDFETVVGGLYPFVMGPAQGVDDQVTHLSERHDPYTQSGWGNALLDDVITGDWSLKHHGNNTGLIYRTIPQNLRFEPGKTYTVKFKYQAGHENMYYIVAGDGDKETWVSPQFLSETAAAGKGQHSTTETYEFQITGAASGQSWFGLACNRTSEYDADTAENSAAKAYGRVDFVLDDLEVKPLGVSLSPSSVTVSKKDDPIELEVTFTNGTGEVEWSSSNENVATVQANAADSKKATVTMKDYGDATISAAVTLGGQEIVMTCSISFPETYELPESDQKFMKWKNVYANTENTSDQTEKEKAIDGDTATQWHSQWSPTAFNVSETNPAIITVEAEEDVESMHRLRIVQRSGNVNGLVQKYKVVVGNTFNEETHEITGTEGTDLFTTDVIEASKTGQGETELCLLPRGAKGKYVQIQVLKGQGNFASIAEIMLDKVGWTKNAFTDLQAAISDADKKKAEGSSQYAAESWKKFEDAYNAAKKADEDTSVEDLLALMNDLKAAMENLKTAADEARDNLRAALSKAEATYAAGQGYYTAASWNAFKTAYENADKGKEGTDAKELNNLMSALNKALGELKDERETLDQEKAVADIIYASMKDGYTAASWAVFAQAYEKLDSALKIPDLSMAARKELQNKLAEAQKALVPNEEKIKDSAQTVIDKEKPQATGGNKNNYTVAAWNDYMDAYNKLNAALSDSSKTAEELSKLQIELAAKKAALKVDSDWVAAKNALISALNSAKPKYAKGSKAYTAATWNPFKTAYDNANKQRNATIANSTAKQLKDLASALTRTGNALKAAANNTVKPPVVTLKSGDSYTAGNVTYVVTSATAKTVSAEAAKTANKNAKLKIKIEDTVTIKGVTCTVTVIKAKAFNKFKKITQVTIGKNVTKVGSQAFNGCQSITKVTVNGDVKTFDKQAFSGCKKLKTLTFKGKKVPKFGKNVFKGTPSNMKVALSKSLKKGKAKKTMTKNLQKAGVNKKAKIK